MNSLFRTSTPIVEVTERWVTTLPAPVALDAIAQAFSDLGNKVDRDGGTVKVRSGSNWTFRMFGNLLSSGKDLPVALDVTAAPLTGGSAVHVYAYDTFGFRVTDRLFFGAKESFETRLEELLTTAASAVQARDRGSGGI